MEDKYKKTLMEVEKFIEANPDLVLIRQYDDKGSLTFNVSDKYTHSFFLIDDENFAELLVQALLDRKVEVFDGFKDLEMKYHKRLERPYNWPADLPWPPDSMK